MRSRLHLLLIPTAAILCTLPLLLNGPSCGHDFDFHLISWLDAARQISHGNLHPYWAFTPAFGAGEPRFVFYPPLSWTIGALLTLLLTLLPSISPSQAFTLAPILYTGIALSTAGLAMYALARRYAPPPIALLASTFYLANPYTLFTAYQRTAFAELLAAAWLPLLLLAILPPPANPAPSPPSPIRHRSILLLALSLALLWITNAPAAVIGSYTVALVALFRLLSLYRSHRSLRPLRKPAATLLLGTSLGLALAAFYIVPAAYERRWVQIDMATIPGMRIADNTLFHHSGDTPHDVVLETASDIALLLLSTTAAALLTASLRTRRRTAPAENPHLTPHPHPATSRPLLLLLSLLTAAIAFLLTPISLPLWAHIPELAFLQFPWRTLAVLAPLTALSVALALNTLPLRKPLAIALALLLPAALAYAAYTTFRETCDGPDTPAAQLALFQSPAGSEPTDEYTPNTADNDSLQHQTPATTCPTGASPQSTPHGQTPLHLRLDTPGCDLVLNLRDFPAWHILRNGIPVTKRIPRDDGLLALHLPPGSSTIDIRYITTPDQLVGNTISAIALAIFVPMLWLPTRRRHRQTPAPPPDPTH